MEQKEIKLTDIFKECIQKKIVLAIVLVGSLLLGALFFGVVFNKINEQYSMNFSLTFEGIDNDKYANGNDFSFQKMISRENISEAINKSESIKNLDADSIYNHLSISQRNGSNNTKNYTLSISKKYLKNGEAKELFVELIKLEYDRILANSNMVTNDNLVLFKDSNSYDNQIDLLLEQVDLLIEKYDELIEKYGNASYEGKTINEYKKAVIDYSDSNILQGINVYIDERGFVKDYEVDRTLLEYQKLALSNEYNLNKKIIDDMTAVINSTTNTVLADELMIKLMGIVEKNVIIDSEIKSIEKKLLNSTTQTERLELETDLNQQADKITDFTDTFNDVYSNCAVQEIAYNDVFTSGTVNIFVGMILFLLLASIIYFSVCAIRVYKRA